MRRPVAQGAVITACAFSSMAAISVIAVFPESMRIALGILLVFFLPGFVTLSAFGPGLQLSWTEFVLASLGISISLATCVAVLLGATPIGLSGSSFSITLGGGAVIMSIYILAKNPLRADKHQSHRSKVRGI